MSEAQGFWSLEYFNQRQEEMILTHYGILLIMGSSVSNGSKIFCKNKVPELQKGHSIYVRV